MSLEWIKTDTASVVNHLIEELKYFKLKLSKTKLFEFIDMLKTYYKDLPFHNFRHVYHVALTCIRLLKVYDSTVTNKLEAKYVFVIIFAALCHDLDHTGDTNPPNHQASELLSDKNIDYEVERIDSPSSRNENKHVAIALVLFKMYAHDLCKNKIHHSYYTLLLYNMILSTDMGLHGNLQTHICKHVAASQFMHTTSPIHFAMLIIKCADVGHFVCHPSTHMYWVFKLEEENNQTQNERMESSFNSSLKNISVLDSDSDYYIASLAAKTLSFANTFVYPMFTTFNDCLGISYQTGSLSWNDFLVPKVGQRNYIDDLIMNTCTGSHVPGIEEHTQVCICMIDIVNFTQWSEDDKPRHVFRVMSKFNELVLSLINEYEDIEKIEMVGDSMMILGGLRKTVPKHDIKYNMLTFATNLLNKVPDIQTLFNDPRVSIRIGIHVGDVAIGYVFEPTRVQVYGNPICIASRLERVCAPGAIMVSDSFLDGMCITSYVDVGKHGTVNIKGITEPLECTMLFVRSEKKIIVTDININETCAVRLATDIESIKYMLYSGQVEHLVVGSDFDDGELKSFMTEYRPWESKYRCSRTNIMTLWDGEKKPKSNSFDLIDTKQLMVLISNSRLYWTI